MNVKFAEAIAEHALSVLMEGGEGAYSEYSDRFLSKLDPKEVMLIGAVVPGLLD
tara:strand:+ start:256 stop:417 length:162 start_codon:yes stop_codon:yes gene_type:complete